MKTSVIPIGDKVTGTAKFQLEVSDNKDVIFSPPRLRTPLKYIHRLQVKNPWSERNQRIVCVARKDNGRDLNVPRHTSR
jgi:hypothetical protein